MGEGRQHDPSTWDPMPRELVHEWATSSGLEPVTRRTYAKHLKRYCAHLRDMGLDPSGLTPEDLAGYRNALLEGGLGDGSAATYLAAARSFHRFASERGLPDPSFPTHRERGGVEAKILSARDVERLLAFHDVGPTASAKSLRNAAMTSLMVHTGLRGGEVAAASCGDVRASFGEKVLEVRGTGGGLVVLTEPVTEALDAYLSTRARASGDAPLFECLSNSNLGGHLTARSVSRIIRAALDEIGLSGDGWSPRSLRATCAALAREGGAEEDDVAAMLRLSDVPARAVAADAERRVAHAAEHAVTRALGGM